MFGKSKYAKADKKKALERMLYFVEGGISAEVFWREYQTSKIMQEILINDKRRQKGLYCWDEINKILIFDKNKFSDSNNMYKPENLLEKINIEQMESRVELMGIIRRYFIRRKIRVKPFDELFIKIQPEWLEIRDEVYLQNTINLMPQGLTEVAKEEWCKKRILELFQYDSKPPEWVQSPEWPIVNGKPLVFRGQSDEKIDDERVYYYFYNPETAEEVTIEQIF